MFFNYETSQNSLILEELVLEENDFGHTGIRGGYYRNRLIGTIYSWGADQEDSALGTKIRFCVYCSVALDFFTRSEIY